MLEDSDELERVYGTVARMGDSAVPANPEEEVACHYICFVRSHKDGYLYELDGDTRGPINTGVVLTHHDILAPKPLEVVTRYIQQEKECVNFNIMALVCRPICG